MCRLCAQGRQRKAEPQAATQRAAGAETVNAPAEAAEACCGPLQVADDEGAGLAHFGPPKPSRTAVARSCRRLRWPALHALA